MRTLSITILSCLVAFAGCDRSKPAPEGEAVGTTASTLGESRTVRASGSSALQPLVNAAKEKYEAAHPKASIEVSAGGSKKGLSDVASGAVDVGNSDIFAAADQKATLVDHKVAVVGFAVMANKGAFNEKVPALTKEQIAQIFTGAIKNWKDVGGAPQPIAVINRAPGSGTRTVFGNAVLGGDRFVESQTEDNSGQLVTKLKSTPGAISYLALSFAQESLWVGGIVKDGKTIEPTEANITSGAYPIWSYEHMYTKGEAKGGTKDFLDYVLGSEFQTTVLPGVKGFIPVGKMTTSKDAD